MNKKIDFEELSAQLEKVRQYYTNAPGAVIGETGIVIVQRAADQGEDLICRKPVTARGHTYKPGEVFKDWTGNDKDLILAQQGYFVPSSMYSQAKKKHDLKSYYTDEIAPLEQLHKNNDREIKRLRGELGAAEAEVISLRTRIADVTAHSEDILRSLAEKSSDIILE